MTRSDPTRAGFTLVELLVALLIFALLSAASAALLRFGVDARQATGQRLDRQAALVRLRALLAADLAQAAPRLWRDVDGVRQAAFASEDAQLLLVRRGWRNDRGAERSSLQRVEYRLAGGRFERHVAPMLDGTAFGPPAVLAEGVTTVRWRFFADGAWRDRWDALAPAALPLAVELTLAATGMPEVRQRFLVGPGPEIAPTRAEGQ